MPSNLVLSSPVFVDSGAFGQRMSGGTGEAGVSLIPASGIFTLEARFRITDISGTFAICGTPGAAWLGIHTGGKPSVTYGTTDAGVVSNVNAADGNVHHLAAEIDPSGATPTTLYLDGALVGQVAASRTIGTTMKFCVRKLHTYLTYPGEVDEVAIWSGRKYGAPFTPRTTPIVDSTPDLIAVYHLNGNGVDSILPPIIETKPLLVSAVCNDPNQVVFTFDQVLDNTNVPPTSTFTLSGKTFTTMTVADKTVTLSGLSPMAAYGETINGGYTKPANGTTLQNYGGYEVDTFNTVITNNLKDLPPTPGYIVKTFGAAAGNDFQTKEALKAYFDANGGLNLVTAGKPLIVWCYDPLVLSGFNNFGPKITDATMYATIRPAPGMSFDDIEDDITPSQINTTGLTLTIGNSSCRMGVIFEGWRVLHTSGTATFRGDGWDNAGGPGGFRKCRLDITTPERPFTFGEYNSAPRFEDCLVVHNNATYNGALANTTGRGIAVRSTFVRLGNTANISGLSSGSRFSEVTDCLFYDMGDNPNQQANGSNNYTNKPIWNEAVNLTYVSGNFFNAAGDYRPAVGSPMIGGASLSAVSTNDNHGNNRGPDPDAGATQLAPSEPLITSIVTSDNTVNGEEITFSGTYTGTPLTATGSILPANPANGASAQGPINLTLENGNWSVKFMNVASGNYQPVFTFTNNGGVSQAIGAVTFEVMGLETTTIDTPTDGSVTPEDPPPPVAVAPTVSINFTLSGKTANVSGTINTQGDPAGTVTLYADPQPSGLSVNMGTAPIANGLYNKTVVLTKGRWKLRAVAQANSLQTSIATVELRVQGINPSTFTLPVA